MAGAARPDTVPEMGVKAPAAGTAVMAIVTAPGEGAGEGAGEEGGLAAGEPPVNPGGYCAAATSIPEYAGTAASGPPAAAATARLIEKRGAHDRKGVIVHVIKEG